MAKRYFWLKLREGWFRDKRIKKLRTIAGGDTYTIIYLKMQLLSLKDEGKLYFEGVEDDFSSEIALEIDEEPEDVKLTVRYLMANGLIEVVNEDEYLLTEVPKVIGCETESARKMRRHRESIKNESLLEGSQCDPDVTKCDTEIDIDKDTEIESDIQIDTELNLELRDKEKTLTVSKDTVCRTDVQRVVDKWNSAGLNPIVRMDKESNRCRSLHMRIRENGIENVLAAIENIRKSDFLRGQNKTGWTITFDWFVKPNNFMKVLEGQYTNGQIRNSVSEVDSWNA